MPETPGRNPRRVVTHSTAALRDQVAIYDYTAEQWGQKQAEDYLDFLDGVIQRLADAPKVAKPVRKDSKIRSFVARWNNTRQGHRIFFVETDDGNSVLRILHTAMNWPDDFGTG